MLYTDGFAKPSCASLTYDFKIGGVRLRFWKRVYSMIKPSSQCRARSHLPSYHFRTLRTFFLPLSQHPAALQRKCDPHEEL